MLCCCHCCEPVPVRSCARELVCARVRFVRVRASACAYACVSARWGGMDVYGAHPAGRGARQRPEPGPGGAAAARGLPRAPPRRAAARSLPAACWRGRLRARLKGSPQKAAAACPGRVRAVSGPAVRLPPLLSLATQPALAHYQPRGPPHRWADSESAAPAAQRRPAGRGGRLPCTLSGATSVGESARV